MFVWLEQVQEGAAAHHRLRCFGGFSVTCPEGRGEGSVLFPPGASPGLPREAPGVGTGGAALRRLCRGHQHLPVPSHHPHLTLCRAGLGCNGGQGLCSPTSWSSRQCHQHQVGASARGHSRGRVGRFPGHCTPRAGGRMKMPSGGLTAPVLGLGDAPGAGKALWASQGPTVEFHILR